MSEIDTDNLYLFEKIRLIVPYINVTTNWKDIYDILLPEIMLNSPVQVNLCRSLHIKLSAYQMKQHNTVEQWIYFIIKNSILIEIAKNRLLLLIPKLNLSDNGILPEIHTLITFFGYCLCFFPQEMVAFYCIQDIIKDIKDELSTHDIYLSNDFEHFFYISENYLSRDEIRKTLIGMRMTIKNQKHKAFESNKFKINIYIQKSDNDLEIFLKNMYY